MKKWIPFYGSFKPGYLLDLPMSATRIMAWSLYHGTIWAFSIMLLFCATGHCRAQTWTLLADYPYVVTDIDYDPQGNLYVTRQQGSLTKNGDTLKVFQVQFINECGLVAMEFAPEGFYLHLSSPDSVQRVIRYDTTLDVIDTLIGVPYKNPFTSRHRGGDLYLLDSVLYCSFGYGANFNHAQDLKNMRGKLVKIIPDSAGFAEIVAFGLRNPYRFDIQYPDIYIADVGWNSFEEANYFNLELDTLLNYGWPCTEGDSILNDTCEWEYVWPVYFYPHPAPPDDAASIIGGVYWNDEWYFCDYYTGYGGSLDSFGAFTPFPIEFPSHVTCMAVDHKNNLVVGTWGGNIYRFEQNPLSIDTTEEEKPYLYHNKEWEYWVDEMISRYGDIYLTIDFHRVFGLPTIPGMYYSVWRKTWIFVF